MITAIAILSLIGFIVGVLHDLIFEDYIEYPNPRLFLCSIAVISWWTLCFPMAIILLSLSGIWLLVCIIAHKP